MQDYEGNYIRWNKNFEISSGYSSEELKVLNPLKFFLDKDLDRVRAAIQKVFDEGYAEIETDVINKEGKIIPFFLKANAIIYEGKKCLCGTGTDLTPQYRSREDLRNSEENYRSLFEQASDAIMVTDFESNFIDVNESICKMFGYTKEELLTMKVEELIDQEQLKALPIQFDLLAAGQQVFSNRKMIHKDGSIIEVEANVKKFGENHLLAIARDITERRKAEVKLKESEERFRALVENAPDALFVFDLNKAKFVSVSKSATELFKLTEGEMLQISPLDISPEFQPDGIHSGIKIKKNIDAVMAGEKPFFEWTHCDKFKNPIPCEVWLVRLPSESEILIRGSVRDISERKRTEESIRLSEQKYRLLFFKNPMPMLMLSMPDMNFIDVNEAALKQYGYSREEFLTMSAKDIRPAEDIKKFWEKMENKSRGINNFGIVRHLKKDGSIINVDVTAHELTYDGKPVFLIHVNDVTEKIAAEEKLKESEFFFRKVTENEMVGVAWATEDGKLINANTAFCDMMGYELDELKGQYFGDFSHPEDTAKELNLVEDILSGKIDYYQMEKRYRKKDGSYIWAELSLSCYRNSEQNKISFFVGIIQNINERKIAEKELERSHESLRQLSHHLETIREEERSFIAREIHDELGQQLTGLKMDASWLHKKISPEQTALRTKLEGMISLIDDTVKTVRRISSELRPGILDDLGLIDALQWQSIEFEKRTGVKCRFYTTFSEPVFERKLSTGIFRVFQETLTNAARHSKASEIKITLEKRDDNIILEVFDNGSGFEEKEVRNKKTLGIIGMNERANMFGGKLTIQSGSGKGTLVSLSVPYRIAMSEMEEVK